jgi:hypothetical protein
MESQVDIREMSEVQLFISGTKVFSIILKEQMMIPGLRIQDFRKCLIGLPLPFHLVLFFPRRF